VESRQHIHIYCNLVFFSFPSLRRVRSENIRTKSHRQANPPTPNFFGRQKPPFLLHLHLYLPPSLPPYPASPPTG
jgi:hypothetical protein